MAEPEKQPEAKPGADIVARAMAAVAAGASPAELEALIQELGAVGAVNADAGLAQAFVQGALVTTTQASKSKEQQPDPATIIATAQKDGIITQDQADKVIALSQAKPAAQQETAPVTVTAENATALSGTDIKGGEVKDKERLLEKFKVGTGPASIEL